MADRLPPVIAIDGPSASGKGTVAERVARQLGFHYLDSGALYRTVAWAALNADSNLENELEIRDIALNLNVKFNNGIWLDQQEIGAALRIETISKAASRVAALPQVRQALLARQRAFRQPPGLVADGRDMGSVVFPDALLKIFLTATPEARAERRYKQLMDKGISASMTTLLQDIRDRDARDSARAVAPLRKCVDAIYLDTTALTIEQVVAQVLAQYEVALRVP
jgi:3-phosphoshikimate 1-carboxyvinyltransferase/cytidylate kinase